MDHMCVSKQWFCFLNCQKSFWNLFYCPTLDLTSAMGVYMSQPCREKVSDDQEGSTLSFGASSMQGWRKTQEVLSPLCYSLILIELQMFHRFRQFAWHFDTIFNLFRLLSLFVVQDHLCTPCTSWQITTLLYHWRGRVGLAPHQKCPGLQLLPIRHISVQFLTYLL